MSKDKKDKKEAKPAAVKAPEAATPAAPAAAPGIQIITQYIKDLSFENPNAPESLVGGWAAPDTGVQVFLGHKPLRENAYECTVHFRVEAKKKGEQRVCFIIDLHYSALAVLHNIPAESHQPVMMVEVPKLLFPFAREIVANLTGAGGYPPLYLAPINFDAIYMQEMKRLQAQQKTGAKA
jgi:preprotein translocase subunit SecB